MSLPQPHIIAGVDISNSLTIFDERKPNSPLFHYALSEEIEIVYKMQISKEYLFMLVETTSQTSHILYYDLFVNHQKYMICK